MKEITIQEIRMRQISLLLFLDKICSENNIKYSLSDGTLLGAIRHKGFIPWDDDIDVMMPREDYERFLSLSCKRFSNKRICSCFSDKKYPFPFAKIMDTETLINEGVDYDFDMGVYIDIFPYDKSSSCFSSRILFVLLIFFNYKISKICNDKKGRKIRQCIVKYCLPFLSLNKISRFINKMAIKENKKNNSVYRELCFLSYDVSQKAFDISMFENFIIVEFEKHSFPSISSYNDYLISKYGDYMTPPPEEDRKRHFSKAYIK